MRHTLSDFKRLSSQLSFSAYGINSSTGFEVIKYEVNSNFTYLSAHESGNEVAT